MRFIVILCCLALIAPTAAAPQASSDNAQAYRKAAARRGVASQVVYLPADAPLPKVGIAPPKPPKPPEKSGGTGDGAGGGSSLAIVISALVLGAVLFAALRFGGARTASFARAPDIGPRHRTAPKAPDPVPEALDLARIAAIPDRRVALEALWLAALGRAAALHGLTLGRSWTARDALRRVPGAWAHRAALAQIARAAELATFGGREVPEDQFHALLSAAAPIFARGHTA